MRFLYSHKKYQGGHTYSNSKYSDSCHSLNTYMLEALHVLSPIQQPWKVFTDQAPEDENRLINMQSHSYKEMEYWDLNIGISPKLLFFKLTCIS